MAVSLSRRSGEPAPVGATGAARVDRRTKNLTKRLQPGDIAVIDHEDIDRVSAEALVACRPAAVVNASPSISGRYPNAGPQILVEAGVPVIDAAGKDVMTAIEEGQWLRIEDGAVYAVNGSGGAGGPRLASGMQLTPEGVADAMALARENLSGQLQAFAQNTMDYLVREKDLLIDGVGVPDIRTRIEGRHALIVVRGYHYKEDLQALHHYIREYKPVLIGVDGGADALLEARHRPDLIVGDMDSVSDRALTCGAEIVVHAYRDGRAPGAERVRGLGVEPVIFPATGTSEDVAMLLADDKDATLIVAVGTHATLVEFLDKGRSGMASTFLTRLRIGSKLVDAKGVSRLYRSRISALSMLAMLLVGLLVLGLALWATPGGTIILQLLGARWDDIWAGIVGIFT
ncbi:putative cytokinetic ring protein SteA [Nostocoides sp.]|jgi:uncharacterized membrane-anchored protein|uniref:putative cytokinetic ring protein SteA n=1 Tax=Nostocoides sp. TaxID=1917966 RepID=UPI002BEF7A50|nr:putative cytokinetic ring protein SteA [Tetrasphaera sp.]